MKRIFKSSNFWNAVFGTLCLILTHKFTGGDTLVLTFVGGLFGGRTLLSGGSDFVKANKGIYYDQHEQKEKIIK